MTRTTRWMLILCFVAASVAVAWDFTPLTAGRDKGKSSAASLTQKQAGKREGATKSTRQEKKAAAANTDSEVDENEDPDLPPGMSGKVDKEAYLRARGDYFDMLRGREGEVPEGARERAIQQMERQEKALKSRPAATSVRSLVNTTDWAFIGPNPIPLGQTQGTRVPVSGRTISIAIHPTDPDTVYVGTAQGGLYKSTNGGANWTKLFEFQLETLAIGALTIDPTDSSIVYVGTGENGQSADSFAGKGLYIIRNANSATPTLNGPFRTNSVGGNVFNGRSIGRILVNPLDHNINLCLYRIGKWWKSEYLHVAPGASRTLPFNKCASGDANLRTDSHHRPWRTRSQHH